MKQVILLFTIALYSCSSALDGSIEERENKKIIAFTVKGTIFKNDSIIDYKTETVTLQPGAEEFLLPAIVIKKGKTERIWTPVDSTDLQPGNKGVTNMKLYTGDKTDPDTIYKYKFEVTGQREIKLK
jgi:hypothetical protein